MCFREPVITGGYMKKIPSLKQVKNKLFKLLWMFIARLCMGWKPVCAYERRLPFSLVAMTGRKIHRMTEQMVFSFCRAWSAMPQRLIIVSDGTRSAHEIRRDFAFWNGELVVAEWEDCLADYSGDIEVFKPFAEQSVYGRKFAAMLHFAKKEPILFCDSDVLWFSRLDKLPTGNGVCLKLSEDIEYSYNQDLIKHMGWDWLMKMTPMNVGVVYMSGDLVGESPWFDDAVANLKPPFMFPEQTIMAGANRSGEMWSLSDVHIDLSDLHELFSRKPTWAARHYVYKAKQKYWRDAFVQNLKARISQNKSI
jgi:hypothetical protein